MYVDTSLFTAIKYTQIYYKKLKFIKMYEHTDTEWHHLQSQEM